MGLVRGVDLATGDEVGPAVGPDALQHPEPTTAVEHARTRAATHRAGPAITSADARGSSGTAGDGSRGVEVERAHEGRGTVEGIPLGCGQLLVAPVQGRLQRPVPTRDIHHRAAQHAEPGRRAQPAAQPPTARPCGWQPSRWPAASRPGAGTAQRPQRGRRPPARLPDPRRAPGRRTGARRRGGPTRLGRAGPPPRRRASSDSPGTGHRTSAERCSGTRLVTRAWTVGASGSTAARNSATAGATSSQLSSTSSACRRASARPITSRSWSAGADITPRARATSGRHHGGVVDRAEVDPHDPVREGAPDAPGDLDGEPGLADPARTGERDDPLARPRAR